MRLIGTVKGKQQAYQFYSFLKGEKIECSYEIDLNEEDQFRFWVIDEDDIEAATRWLTEFQKDSEDPRFTLQQHPIDTQGVGFSERSREAVGEPLSVRSLRFRREMRPHMPLTRLIVFVCALLYFINSYQMTTLSKKSQDPKQYTLTPLMVALSYDIPEEENREALSQQLFSEDRVGNVSSWDGLYEVALKWPASKEELHAPLFVQISRGEVWRLFTPVLLHGSLLHILFNMLWLWMLGRQIEERTKKWQYIGITLIIGIVSNTFQYLMSGPLFIGYSGIVCGLAGFIWMRQRRAPWEGYPLHKGTTTFLALFIFGMTALQVISFFLVRFQIAPFELPIANTAHISGAITGALLGRLSFFSKGRV